MAKKVFTVVEVEGSKRSSEAEYTHALIGQYDPTLLAAHMVAEHKANAARNRKRDTKTWNDSKRSADTPDGEYFINHNNYRVQQRQAYRDIDLKFIAQYPTVDSYLAKREADHLAHLDKLSKEPFGSLTVLRWSRSAANAAKGSSEFQNAYSNLRVVPCVRAK